jgi:hypothetical protein
MPPKQEQLGSAFDDKKFDEKQEQHKVGQHIPSAHSARARSLVDRALSSSSDMPLKQEQLLGSAFDDEKFDEEQEQHNVGQQGSAVDEEKSPGMIDEMPFFEFWE